MEKIKMQTPLVEIDGDAVFQRRVRSVHRHLVARGVAVQKSQIIIYRFQLDKGADQFILDLLPQDPRHLVAVHLHERRCHPDFFHCFSSAYTPYPAA